MDRVSASIAPGTEGSRVTKMRWLADELEDYDDGSQPYKEGTMYICRNCAVEMTRRRSLCARCHKAQRRKQYHACRDAERQMEEE